MRLHLRLSMHCGGLHGVVGIRGWKPDLAWMHPQLGPVVTARSSYQTLWWRALLQFSHRKKLLLPQDKFFYGKRNSWPKIRDFPRKKSGFDVLTKKNETAFTIYDITAELAASVCAMDWRNLLVVMFDWPTLPHAVRWLRCFYFLLKLPDKRSFLDRWRHFRRGSLFIDRAVFSRALVWKI